MTTNPSISTSAGTSTGMSASMSASTGGYRSHKRSRRQHTVRAMALAGITGLALITTVSPADAAAPRTRPKPPALLVSGGATWEERVNGDAVVTGPADVMFRNSDQAISAQLAAVVSPSDHTLPEPETCETAISTITVFDARRVGMTLIGVGEVCGFYPQLPTSAVTHVFTGRYEVLEAKRHNLVGTDGFFEVRLGVNGASAFAIDT